MVQFGYLADCNVQRALCLRQHQAGRVQVLVEQVAESGQARTRRLGPEHAQARRPLGREVVQTFQRDVQRPSAQRRPVQVLGINLGAM